MREWINRFMKKEEPKNIKTSASMAKERLQIVIAKDMNDNILNNELVNKLQIEILELVKKYINIPSENIEIKVDKENGIEVLELNITFPDDFNKSK